MIDIRTAQDLADRVRSWRNGTPWERGAAAAFDRGHYRMIFDRANEDVYMARFWLSPPITRDGVLCSGDSILLHWIVKPDDDGALHDHPWDFTTTILSGSYIEFIASPRPWTWIVGPTDSNVMVMERRAGDVIAHKAEDLHRIGRIFGDVWTLVRTGPKRREWGFHPAGEAWQVWNEYLGIAK